MKTQVHPATKNRYDKFKDIAKATELIVIADNQNSCEYHKLVQSGELEVHDYGIGFLNFEVSMYKSDYEWIVAIYIASIDDGDFGGWSKPLEKSKALKLVKSIAENVMKDMIVFPTKVKLNAILREYGFFVDYE